MTERVFMQKQLSKSFFKKGVMKNFAKFTRKHLCRKNETVAPVFSCDFCEICKITFLLQNIIAVSVVVKRIGTRATSQQKKSSPGEGIDFRAIVRRCS